MVKTQDNISTIINLNAQHISNKQIDTGLPSMVD